MLMSIRNLPIGANTKPDPKVVSIVSNYFQCVKPKRRKFNKLLLLEFIVFCFFFFYEKFWKP